MMLTNTTIYNRPLENRILSCLRTVTGTEKWTNAQVKTHLNKTDSDDDTYLGLLQPQCRRVIENYCSISIVNTTIIAVIKNELGGLELPYGPHGAISTMTDIDGAVITEGTNGYKLRGIQFKWLELPISSFITVSYTAGYENLSDSNAVPDDLKLAILHEVAYRFEHRGDAMAGPCESARILADPYKRKIWL